MFEARCVLEFLDKVTMPMQSPIEGAQRRTPPAAVIGLLQARCRVHVACATSRIDSVPHARCGDRREQAVSPSTGEDMAAR